MSSLLSYFRHILNNRCKEIVGDPWGDLSTWHIPRNLQRWTNLIVLQNEKDVAEAADHRIRLGAGKFFCEDWNDKYFRLVYHTTMPSRSSTIVA